MWSKPERMSAYLSVFMRATFDLKIMTTAMTAHKLTINCLNEPNKQSATNSLLYRMYHGLLIKQFNETNKPTKEIVRFTSNAEER